jgi:hypothetical protein
VDSGALLVAEFAVSAFTPAEGKFGAYTAASKSIFNAIRRIGGI